MKWKALALLFAFAVVILNALLDSKSSGIEKVNCCQQKHQEVDTEPPITSDSDSDCCGNGCNPFVKCCGFMGFVIVQSLSFELLALRSEKEITANYPSIRSQYQGSIWEPPKV